MLKWVCAAALMLGLSAERAGAAEIVVHDDRSQPESLAVAPDGAVFAGSAGSPFVYRLKKGETIAQPFVDASADGPGTFFLGQLVDGAAGTLWTCELTPNPGTDPATRRSSLRGFDLASGKEKLRWNLPGDSSVCNDFVVGPDKALYISDTVNSRIYRLARGATAAELFFENRVLLGIDGITFLDGVLYVNNVIFNKLYRIPMDASGKPGAPVDIWTDAPIKGPDGMRAANGKLFLAENAAGKVDELTIKGDIAHVRVLRDGLKTPTGVDPAGAELWFTERGTGKVWSMPLPR